MWQDIEGKGKDNVLRGLLMEEECYSLFITKCVSENCSSPLSPTSPSSPTPTNRACVSC